MVRVQVGLIDLGNSQLQLLLLLQGQRVPIAQNARQRRSLRVLTAQNNVSRLAGEYTAQLLLAPALAVDQVSKMILGAPRSGSGKVAHRCRALQIVRA